MFFYYLSIAITITANFCYYLFQKSISQTVNPILSLIVTYISALIVSLILYPLFRAPGSSIVQELSKLNWASFVLGFAIIGLEVGFLLTYRAGWNLGSAGIYSNVVVALLLIPVWLFFFKEHLSGYNALGIVFCILGLLLVNYKTL